MKFWMGVAVCIVALAGAAGVADAQASKVESALEQLGEALKDEQGLSQETRDALSALVDALREERAAAPSDYVPTGPPVDDTGEKTLRERTHFYGDARARVEANLDTANGVDRYRERVRLRAGVNIDVTDDLVVGARLVTGSSDTPTSTHQTLGNVYDSFEVSLDRLYLKWSPDGLPGASFTIGKFGNPFYRNPVHGDLLWDSDVQPEGIAVTYARENVGFFDELNLAAGEYIVLEQSAAKEALTFTAQAHGVVGLTDTLKLDLAVGYYHYNDADPDGSPKIALDNETKINGPGNQTIDLDGDGVGDVFRSEFDLLNPIAALTYTGWRMPITFSTEYIKNMRGRGSEDAGWAVGASLGKAKSKGDWMTYYNYSVVEQEAVLAALAGDLHLMTTNHAGHVFGAKYQFTDRVQVHGYGAVTATDEDPVVGPDDFSRFRLDLNIKL